MTPIDTEILPTEGLVVLTCKTIDYNAPFYAADFKDQQIVLFKETNSPIGVHMTRGIRLGKRPFFMRNGIWYMEEDVEIQDQYANIVITPERVCMGAIE